MLLSFEFYPPKSDKGLLQLTETVLTLSATKPEFFSVTYGAGGSTQAGTIETVDHIITLNQQAVPHLACIGANRDEILELLMTYKAKGINRLVALRGDIPSGTLNSGDFRYANELVEFIRQKTGDFFDITVAAYPEFHPESDSAKSELLHFVNKINCGADRAITQYFFNADAYFYFVEACAKKRVRTPIIPGIMPIRDFKQLARFSESCGAEIPRWLKKSCEVFTENKEALLEYGIEIVTRLCEKLIKGGAPGLHFYTLNHAEPVFAICQNLKYLLGLSGSGVKKKRGVQEKILETLP